MEYLQSTIIDELVANDIEPFECVHDLNKLTSNHLVLYRSIFNIITIQNFNLIYKSDYGSGRSLRNFYAIPLDLNPLKILDIIWSIFDNDCANKINLTNETKPSDEYLQINYFRNKYFNSISITINYVNIYKIRDLNRTTTCSKTDLIIIHSPKQNFKSMVANKFEHIINLTILYKL